MSCAVHHIGNHRARRRQLSRPAAIIHGISQHIPVHIHGIKNIVHTVKRMLPGDQKRRNHCEKSLLRIPAQCQKFYRLVHLFRIFKISRGNPGNSLRIDILIVHVFSRHEGRENRNLPAGVVPLHVSLRISLRVAFILRLLQYLVKIDAFLVHLCENIVGRPVQNSRNAVNMLRRQGIV